MPISLNTILALTARFHVSIKDTAADVDLGGWARCQGLQVKFNPEPYKEGGNYQYEPILQGHIQYPNVTLTRAMNGEDTKKVQEWLRERASNWIDGLSSGSSSLRRMVNMKGFGGTAKITLFDAHGQEVSSWHLRNVYPAMWKGPDLDASTLGVAIESLELAHEGFL